MCYLFYIVFGRPDRNNIAGVFVVCKARLIGTENYATLPKYIMDVGGDYWRNLTVQWASDYSKQRVLFTEERKANARVNAFLDV